MMWEKVRLGDVFTLIRNGASIKQFDNASGLPITRIETISSTEIDKSKLGYANIVDGEYNDYYLQNGDILMSHINSLAHLGKCALVTNLTEKIIHGMNLLLLRCAEGVLDSKYAKYYFTTPTFKQDVLKISNQSVNQCSFSLNKLKELQIPLPPLPIQKRIAEILDTADALRRKDEALLKKYDELAQAIFIDMFGDPVKNEKGWEVKKLKSCTSKIGSGSTPTGGKTAYKEQGISLIRSMNVYDNYFKMKDLAFIDDIQAEKLKNVEVKSNDVLFNITGASVCRCTIVPEEILPARVNQHVAILRAKEELLSPKFLSTLLTTNSMKKQLLNIGMAGGAVMEAITKDQLENQNIILPPIEVQNRFANILKNLNEQNQKSSICQKESDSLFNSLLQKAFNGELVA